MGIAWNLSRFNLSTPTSALHGLQESRSKLKSRTLLQSVATLTKPQLDSLADANLQKLGSLDPRHKAAIDIHAQLGSMVPVLDGLSARALASQKFSRMFSRVLWYLAFVLLVALLGLIFFKFYIAPEYELVRQDMRLHYDMTDFNGDTFPYVIPLIVVFSVLLV